MSRKLTRATSFDVAALARVSQSAVSRAFSPGSSISERKRAQILEAARKLNYVPNSMAASLTTRRSNTVAVILGHLANPFYVTVLSALIQRLQDEGRQALTFTVDHQADADAVMMRVLRYQVDGIILTSAQLSTRMAAICHDRGIPIVLFNRYIPGTEASGVRCDNIGGGRLMAQAFLSAGARRFALILGDTRGTTSADRARGFTEALVESGIARADIRVMEGNSTYDGAHSAVATSFDDGRLPDAFFAVNDIMAMATMDALRERFALRIPDDIMVAGFDDIPDARRWPYRLTTVSQPVDEMVEETFKILNLDDVERPIEPGIDMVVPVHLIWRETVRPPRRTDGKSSTRTG